MLTKRFISKLELNLDTLARIKRQKQHNAINKRRETIKQKKEQV